MFYAWLSFLTRGFRSPKCFFLFSLVALDFDDCPGASRWGSPSASGVKRTNCRMSNRKRLNYPEKPKSQCLQHSFWSDSKRTRQERNTPNGDGTAGQQARNRHSNSSCENDVVLTQGPEEKAPAFYTMCASMPCSYNVSRATLRLAYARLINNSAFIEVCLYRVVRYAVKNVTVLTFKTFLCEVKYFIGSG